jgi:hypothetical protein
MEEKLTELQRPPFWSGLEDLLRRLRVPWQDLYPEPTPERPTFLALRNRLFHSHQTTDAETLLKDTLRLEGVVKRMLLRWLGWQDLWLTPHPVIRGFVAGKALPHSPWMKLLNTPAGRRLEVAQRRRTNKFFEKLRNKKKRRSKKSR